MRVQVRQDRFNVGIGDLGLLQHRSEQAYHLIERTIVDLQMVVRLAQRRAALARRPTHHRGHELGLMLDQALHIDVGKEWRELGAGQHPIVEVEHEAGDEWQAAIALEHRIGRHRIHSQDKALLRKQRPC